MKSQVDKITEAISVLDMTPSDLDGIAYQVVHYGSEKVWERAKVLGESLSYHADKMYKYKVQREEEGEQLWLMFDQ
jgi:hypothetical protein